MSAFGKYGTGGSVPGKPETASGPDESMLDFEAAALGTDRNQPDTKPEVFIPSQARNKTHGT